MDAYITLTEFSRDLACHGGLDPDRVFVKPNFLAPDPGIGHGGNAFLFVGRLSAEKGIGTLLAAWELIGDRGVQLDVAGDGPLREQVEQSQSRMNVRWLGRLSHDEAIQRMGSARALLVPSECYETFGRVVMEAFSRGTPVVASKHGALAELVDHEKTGLQFEPGNAHELGRHVARLHQASPDWMRRDARQAYVQRFGPDVNYDRLMSIYQSAIEYRAARRRVRR